MINKGMIDPLRIKSLPSNLGQLAPTPAALSWKGCLKAFAIMAYDLASAFRLFFSSLPKYVLGAEERRSVGKN